MNAGNAAEPHSYVGSELAIFEHAIRWKAYLGDLLAPYLRGEVLEIGAGIGGSTPFLLNDAVARVRLAALGVLGRGNAEQQHGAHAERSQLRRLAGEQVHR